MDTIYINANLSGNAHEMIDSALIGMLSKSGSLEAFTIEDRVPCLKQMVDERFCGNSIKWHSLKKIKSNRLKALRVAFLEASIVFKEDKRKLFLVSFMNGYSSNIHNLISFITGAKLLLVAHNDLECVLTDWKKQRGIQKLLHNYFFKYVPIAKNLRILVLGDNIIENLSQYLSSKKLKHFVSIDHPYYVDPLSEQVNLKDEINIGLPGRIDSRPSRGFDNLCDFANKVLNDKKIKIHIISSIEEKLIERLPPNIFHNDSNSNLPRKEYEEIMRKMDFILLPYHKDYYKVTVSGAVFEAITKLKPALMYSTDYFKYLSGKYGEFGIFIDQEDEERLIEMLHDETLYKKFVGVEKKISKVVDPLALSESFCMRINKLW